MIKILIRYQLSKHLTTQKLLCSVDITRDKDLKCLNDLIKTGDVAMAANSVRANSKYAAVTLTSGNSIRETDVDDNSKEILHFPI